MLDTHAHLTDLQFASDLPDVLSRAHDAGLDGVVVVSNSLRDCHSVLSLASSHPLLLPALGLHPEHISSLRNSLLSPTLAAFGGLLRQTPNALIGEIGLDYTPRVLGSRSANMRAVQRESFAYLLRESAESVATVHSRGAGHYALDVIREENRGKVIMHAFDGKVKYAERAIGGGTSVWFSVPPCVVRSDGMTKLVKRIPMERLLLESDSPALGVQVGTRNEPSQVVRVVQQIALVKGVSEEIVRHMMRSNERDVYGDIWQSGIGCFD